MIYGMDFLGGARYAGTVLAEHPRAYGFGVFADVDGFGKAYQLIGQVAALGVPFIRVHLIWKDDHNFTSSDIKTAEQRAKLLKPIIAKYGAVKWYISPCCEHNLSAAQFEPFAAAVLRHLPSAEIVNTPMKGHISDKYINELHNADKPRGKRFAFSFDGSNCVDADFVSRSNAFNKAEYFFIWNSQCNGRRNAADSTPRAKRVYWPVPEQIDSWIYLTTHRKGATKIPKGWIFKSHADQHSMPPAGKDQKPVWVKLPNFKAIEVRARNGQLIDRAPYFGRYEGGGHRYYHSNWGYILAEKAMRIQGDGLCEVFANNKKVGLINLAFRDGVYR